MGTGFRNGGGHSGTNDLLERRAFAGNIWVSKPSKSATMAAEFLKPFYAAALAMTAKVAQDTSGLNKRRIPGHFSHRAPGRGPRLFFAPVRKAGITLLGLGLIHLDVLYLNNFIAK